MNTHHKTINEILENEATCPFPIGVIPDQMGINLCSVEAITWTEHKGQLVMNLQIHLSLKFDFL